MEVLLVETEGRGLSAEIEVDGERLVVVDGISRVGEPAAPGPVSRPRFQVVAPEPASWERASSRNPDRSKKLEHLRGWRYLGFGEILSTEPARLDLGVLVLELDLRIGDEGQVGRYVGIDIDRITLSREGPGARESLR